MNDYDREALKDIRATIYEYHNDYDLSDDVLSLIDDLYAMVAEFMIEAVSEDE